MFSFLKRIKNKKSDGIINDNKENDVYNYSLSIVPSTTHEKNLTGDKIHVDINQNPTDTLLLTYNSSEPSPCDLFSSSPPTIHQSCLTHTANTITSHQIDKSDLNRVLTSGYLNGEVNMGYMKRTAPGHTASYTKSSQSYRPIGFSYNRTQTFTVPGTKKGMKALVTGQTKIRKIHCSTPQSVPVTPEHRSDSDTEPIILSRYSGGFIPDPSAPKKIESLDWPAPIAIQAVPELLKSHRSRSESCSNHNETNTIIDDLNEQIIIQEDLVENDDKDLRHDEQLEKDINEMSKIKDSSGMAHALLEDLRIQEKIISKQLPLDPWKASRSPSAAIEPPRRCRFDSPKFASPSRRGHTHSSSTTTNHDESFSRVSTPFSPMVHDRKRNTLHRDQQQNELSSNHISIQRSCDLDSTINSSDSNDTNQNKKLFKTVDLNNQCMQTTQTCSAPALMTNAKIYSYNELKVTSKQRLPPDVDRDHLERHLSDKEFYELFQMTQAEFYNLPEWRRVDLKKRIKLF